MEIVTDAQFARGTRAPTLHIVGLPHTMTTAAYSTCAYSMKVRKFAKMMTAAGRRVIVYSGRDNDAPCAEHVQVVTAKERREWFGDHKPGRIFDIDWDPAQPYWQVMNHRAIAEITKRAEPHDLVLLTMGHSQGALKDAVPWTLTAEHGVGYIGTITHAAFESYAWMHHVYGIQAERRQDAQGANGGAFDTVIPNYFDLDEFPAQPVAPRGDPYLLFMGRVMLRKGPHVAARIAAELGMRLLIAGPGVESVRPGEIVGQNVVIEGGHVEYVGSLGFEDRVKVMAGASALLAPTLYVEPFGGVAVESMLCGTPVVASDWGSFTETVQEGVSGARFATLQEGIDATVRAIELPRGKIRPYAVDRYSLAAVAPMYERWFGRLDTLWRGGWDEVRAPG